MRKVLKKVLIGVSSLAFIACSALAISNVYEAKADSDYYVETSTFALKEGASIRLDEPTGIRFTTTVANDYAVDREFGTIIVPKHLNDNDTVDINDAARGLNIPFKNVFAIENGAKVYTAVVGNMPVENPDALNLKFQAASYAKRGNDYTYTQTVTRSISQVASMAYRADSTDTVSLQFINTAISRLSLSMDNTKVDEGKTVKLTVNNLPEGMVAIWSSENEEIATVDADGVVTAKKKGDVTITAQIGGTEVSATVSVHEVLKPRFFTLTDTTDFATLYSSYDMRLGCTITGSSPSVQLTLPAEMSLTGPLTINNVTLSAPQSGTALYANGHKLYIGEDVTSTYHTPSSKEDSTYRLTVYGGAKEAAVESTDITLLGGQYWRVFGGGYEGGSLISVTGDTRVVFGGNVNSKDSIDDSKSNFVSSWLCGGAYHARIGGTTNVTVKGDATIGYVSAVGAYDTYGDQWASSVSKASIHIDGGNVMNVFGGSLLSGKNDGGTVDILMTGGKVESIIGGNQGLLDGWDMNGNVNITLLGGTITRRIIMGCYNDAGTWDYLQSEFDYDNHITGTLTLNISKEMKLWSGTRNDSYIYLGSRYGSNFSDEYVIVNFIECKKSDFKVTFKLNANSTNENVTLPASKEEVWSPFY